MVHSFSRGHMVHMVLIFLYKHKGGQMLPFLKEQSWDAHVNARLQEPGL